MRVLRALAIIYLVIGTICAIAGFDKAFMVMLFTVICWIIPEAVNFYINGWKKQNQEEQSDQDIHGEGDTGSFI